jgi:hypothetical protein
LRPSGPVIDGLVAAVPRLVAVEVRHEEAVPHLIVVEVRREEAANS